MVVTLIQVLAVKEIGKGCGEARSAAPGPGSPEEMLCTHAKEEAGKRSPTPRGGQGVWVFNQM